MTAQKIALVTGANRGIGKEIALQLARDHGYQVYLGSRDLRKGQQAADEIDHGAQAVQLEVTSQSDIDAAIANIKDTHGLLDVLVNNAGVDYDTDQQLLRADLNRVRRTFETNLFGPWALTMAAMPLLRKSASGRIVNVSSGSGSLTEMGAETPGYGLSKTALNALTIKLANALRRDGILVNSVCPGWVATDMGGGGRAIPDGAKGVVWAATLPDGGPTGGFFRDGQPIAW